ncbi:hypothetical protein B4084_5218 [Bacillus cereus]|nr:hypothetical protein B4084_5218 [Bacillus cereus]
MEKVIGKKGKAFWKSFYYRVGYVCDKQKKTAKPSFSFHSCFVLH